MKADTLSVISEIEYHILRRRYELFKKNKSSVNFEKIMEVVNGIANNAELLRDLFKKIDPLATGRGIAKKTFKLKQAIQEALVLFEKEMETNKIFVEIGVPDDFSFSGWDQDIRVIFTNLMDNSVYWISEMKVRRMRKIALLNSKWMGTSWILFTIATLVQELARLNILEAK